MHRISLKRQLLPLGKVFFATILFFSFAPSLSAATTRYIRTDGSDTNCSGLVNVADPGSGVIPRACAWLTPDYALTGSRAAQGDTINITAGTYDAYYGANTRILSTLGAGSGTTTLQAYPAGASVTLNIPAGTQGALLYGPDSKPLLIKGIDFTNTRSLAVGFSVSQADRIVAFQDCTFDLNNVSAYGLQITDSSGTLNSYSLERCTIKNTTGRVFIRNDKVTASKSTITVKSSVFYNWAGLFSGNGPATLFIYNNSFAPVSSGYVFGFSTVGNIIDMRNNIFSSNIAAPTLHFDNTTAPDLISNPSNYVIKNNIFWTSAQTNGALDAIINGSNYLIPIDNTNYYFNPNFNNTSTGDLTINPTPTQWLAGKGDASVLPQYDRNGQAWAGSDVGAHQLPTSVAPTYTSGSSIAFVGDSIMNNSSATTGNGVTSQFTASAGVSSISGSAIGGLKVEGLRHWIDYVAATSTPSKIFLSIGVNNLSFGGVRSPSSMTNQQLATEITSSLQRITNWGITPVWLGVESTSSGQADSDAVNTLVNAWAQSNGVRYGSILDQMRLNANWNLQAESGGYYGCTSSANCGNVGATLSTDVHPNNAGHGVIANLAEYLYFTNHTIGTDGIDIQAGARIYNDGKFRDKGTTSGNKADLTVAPSGAFVSGNYSKWVDISNITWNTSSTYAKEWTASSTVATTTVFTVGDLQANHYYSVLVDGTRVETLQANVNGKITYTYSGGWSSHTFNVNPETSAPLYFALSSPVSGVITDARPSFAWEATTDAESGLAKYQLYVDGVLSQDNITGTTFSPSTGFSCGNHTWYVRAVDNAGNGTNSDTHTFSVSCGGGPMFTGSAASLSGYVAPRMQTITDGVVTYLDTPPTTHQTPVSTTSSFVKVMKRGSKGHDVSALQAFLKKDPTLYPEGLVTGFFGPVTERAVQRFQKKHGIASVGTNGYGTVGPKTRIKLNALMGR